MYAISGIKNFLNEFILNESWYVIEFKQILVRFWYDHCKLIYKRKDYVYFSNNAFLVRTP